jgi:CDP-glycerol glycerophosphotransferase (TagB/SpsB family)
MISDTSSVLYEYLITRKPIIVAETKPADLHNMPDNMNIMNKVDIYDSSDNIVKLIYKNLNDKFLPEKLNELLHNCFYFNDGKATERAAEFIRQL